LTGQEVHCLNCGFTIRIPVLQPAEAPLPPMAQPQAPRPVKIEPALPANAPPVPRQVIADAVDRAGEGAIPAAPPAAPPPLPRRRASIASGNSVVVPPQIDQSGPDIRFVDDADRFSPRSSDPQGSKSGSIAGNSSSNSATHLLAGARDPAATRALGHHSSDSTIAELPPLEGLLPSGEFSFNPLREAWPFGPGQWKTPDTVAINLALWGLLLCLLPQMVRPWTSMGSLAPACLYTGLVLAFTGSALFSMKQRFGMGAIAAILALLAFVHGAATHSTASRPVEVAGANAAPAVEQVAPPEALPRLPVLVTDPVAASLAQLDSPDRATRAKSMEWLLSSTPPARHEEVSRAFEPRLRDADPAVAVLALRGVDLHRDERSLRTILAVLKNSPGAEFKAEVYRILLERKDPLCLETVVPLLSEDHKPVVAIIRAVAATSPQNRAHVTDYLEASLSSPNPRQRELVIEELARFPGPRTAVVLLPSLNDRVTAVRHAAMRALAQLKDPRAVDGLIARLRDDHDQAYAAIEATGAPAEKALVVLLRSNDKLLRETAARLLRTVATRDSLEALRAASADPNYVVATAAMDAWTRIDPQSITPAVLCAFDLESQDPRRWLAALDRLAREKVEKENIGRISPKLMALALHDDKELRSRAVALLPKWSGEDVVPALIRMIDLRTEENQRKRAEAALGAMKDPRGAVAVARYINLDTAEVLESLRAMGMAAQDEVLKLLEDPKAPIRAAAVAILRDNADVQAIPALQRLGAAEPALKADCQAAIAAIRNRLPRN
jgi:HEAT repeat protein